MEEELRTELEAGLWYTLAFELSRRPNMFSLPLVDNWESEACLNFNMLKRRCFWLSSCTGGDTERWSPSQPIVSADILAGAGPSAAVSGDRNSAADGLRGICSLALPSMGGTLGLPFESGE